MKVERQARVGDETWGFRIGRFNAVLVAPDGRKSIVNFSVLTGRSWDALERGVWVVPITPEHIKSYIRKHRGSLVQS